MSCLLSGKKALTIFKVIQLNKNVLDDVKEWMITRVSVIEAELDFRTVQSLYCPFAKNNLWNVLKKKEKKMYLKNMTYMYFVHTEFLYFVLQITWNTK